MMKKLLFFFAFFHAFFVEGQCDLAPGFYIQVEEYFDGTKLIRKIAIR